MKVEVPDSSNPYLLFIGVVVDPEGPMGLQITNGGLTFRVVFEVVSMFDTSL